MALFLKLVSSSKHISNFSRIFKSLEPSIKKTRQLSRNVLTNSLKTIEILTPPVILLSKNLLTVHCRQIKKDEPQNLNEDKNVSKKTHDSFPWKEFFKVLCPHLHWLIGAILGAVIVAYLNIQIPLLLGEMVNVIVKFSKDNNNNEDFLSSIASPVKNLILFYSLQALCTYTYLEMLFRMGEALLRDLRVGLFKSLIVREIEFFDANRTGDLINCLNADVQDFKSSFKLLISQGLKNVVETLGHVASMMHVSSKLTLSMVGMVGLMVVVGKSIGSVLGVMSKEVQQAKSCCSKLAEEALGNIRTVRAFAMEDVEVKRYTENTDNLTQLSNRLGTGISVFQALSNLSINSLVLSTLFYGGYMMSKGDLNAGNLMSLFMDTQAIQRSLNKLSVLYGVGLQGFDAGARVFEQMIGEATMRTKGGLKIPGHSLHGDVQFKGVCFSYPTRPKKVLLDINMEIKAGKKVALVGPSGGGKSTIVSLLERFYDVSEGSICVDGVDVRDLDPSWLRARFIGYISQEPVLFASSIKDNIRYGKPSASDQEVMEAAKQANAHEFISAFPQSYDTMLGERGQSLSGGQRQRIAIARALIKQPPMLVLDEATSALDSVSEKSVQQAIEEASKGRTVLVIAHRLSTVQNVHYVAVVDKGRIVEWGSPEELKKKKGAFWNLMSSQQH